MVTPGSPAWTRWAAARAGPVSVGVALIPAKATKRTTPRWLRDSKQLSEARRESIFESVGVARRLGRRSRHPRRVRPVGDADRPTTGGAAGPGRAGSPPRCPPGRRPAGLVERTGGGTRAAASGTGVHRSGAPGGRLVRGCASVAAASVLAKVVRADFMRAESEHFPAYAFEQNKGYPSPVHQMALRGLRAVDHPSPELGLRGGLPWPCRPAQGPARRGGTEPPGGSVGG